MEDIKTYMKQIGQQARAASRVMAAGRYCTKNRALTEIAAALQSQSAQLLAANARMSRRRALADWMMPRWIG